METRELVDKWLVESLKVKEKVINHYLKAVNKATYNDIIINKDSDKYKDIVLVFIDIDLVKDDDLRGIITRPYDRWHEVGDILNTTGPFPNGTTQGWYSPSSLLEEMTTRIIPKFAYIIIKKEKDAIY